MFHRQYTVRIVGRQCDPIDGTILGDISHIYPDAHLHAFLLEIWMEIGIG